LFFFTYLLTYLLNYYIHKLFSHVAVVLPHLTRFIVINAVFYII